MKTADGHIVKTQPYRSVFPRLSDTSSYKMADIYISFALFLTPMINNRKKNIKRPTQINTEKKIIASAAKQLRECLLWFVNNRAKSVCPKVDLLLSAFGSDAARNGFLRIGKRIAI